MAIKGKLLPLKNIANIYGEVVFYESSLYFVISSCEGFFALFNPIDGVVAKEINNKKTYIVNESIKNILLSKEYINNNCPAKTFELYGYSVFPYDIMFYSLIQKLCVESLSSRKRAGVTTLELPTHDEWMDSESSNDE